jgi:hypothetical protein
MDVPVLSLFAYCSLASNLLDKEQSIGLVRFDNPNKIF